MADREAYLKSGKYDKLAEKGGTMPVENPYVVEPDHYVMGPEAKARREMYVELPSCTELQRIAGE